VDWRCAWRDTLNVPAQITCGRRAQRRGVLIQGCTRPGSEPATWKNTADSLVRPKRGIARASKCVILNFGSHMCGIFLRTVPGFCCRSPQDSPTICGMIFQYLHCGLEKVVFLNLCSSLISWFDLNYEVWYTLAWIWSCRLVLSQGLMLFTPRRQFLLRNKRQQGSAAMFGEVKPRLAYVPIVLRSARLDEARSLWKQTPILGT